MDTIISIRNLTYTYGEEGTEESFTALKDINLDIERGSFVAIIGQNGSGKSTLARCINGLILPTHGSVLVEGVDTTDEENLLTIRQSTGMVFQNPDNQLVSSIVEDDIAFGPENLGVEPAEIQERVDEALKAVDMEAFRDSSPHLLSGGQKQRIAIAGAMAIRPKCIVFDEPTAMLDPKGRKEVMKIIHQLHKEGITCILITHFMEEAAQADRLIILNKGSLYMDGTPREIFVNEEKLEALALDVPMVVDLTYRLRAKGIDIPTGMITEEEFTDALTGWKEKQ